MLPRTLSTSGRQSSLRSRYFRLTLLLTLCISSVALLFYYQAINTNQAVSQRLIVLEEDHETLETIKGDLANTYHDIDLFLLDPSQGGLTDTTQTISAALRKVRQLSSLHLLDDPAASQSAMELSHQLSSLEEHVSKLVVLRMDITRQYPGMSISAFDMTPPQQAVGNHLQLLIDEIESDGYQPRSKEIYPLLLKTYTLWMQHISQMRIYLANRLASFSNEILAPQAKSLSILHQQFQLNIETLEELYSTEESFEAETAIEAVQQNATMWYTLFQQVRAISESDQWRGDTYIMRSTILPLIADISDSLLQLEKWLSEEENRFAEQLHESTDTLSSLLFTIIALFLLFTLGLIISLDVMVFRPIASVTEALKSKAINHDMPAIIASNAQEIRHLIEAFQHMDEEVNQRQRDLEHHALHDHLTGLPNRLMLSQRIEYQLLTAERNKQPFTLLLIDLNNFKDVNDSLGHAIGDLLLIEVAKQLTESVRKADTVARLGGDEFAVMLAETDTDSAEKLAEKLIHAFDKPVVIDDNALNIGLSIGIVSYPDDGADTQVLMQHADIAMYHAKRHKTGFAHYNTNDDFYQANRLSLIADLNQALLDETLELYFQPQFNVKTGLISGAEALLRWDHPEHGLIQSDKAIELAEYSGTISKLSLWVLDKAIEQCVRWHHCGVKVSIAVNLSVQDLGNRMFCEHIGELLMRHGLAAEYLILELTENSMMGNPTRTIDMLNKLHEMGVQLSIDDFGTGFSSLSYLKKLPVSELKIDKSFVLDMERSESDRLIVQSTINLGHNLGLKVIAEGIERQTLLDSIRELGCDYVQGYLFGNPKSSEEFLAFIKQYEQPEVTSLTQPAEQTVSA